MEEGRQGSMYTEQDDQQIRFTKSYEQELLPCDKCLHVTKVKEVEARKQLNCKVPILQAIYWILENCSIIIFLLKPNFKTYDK